MNDIFDFAPSVPQSSKVYLAKCNFHKLFVPKSLKVLSTETKASGSDTIIVFGKLRSSSENVVIKINFPEIYDYESSGLESEVELCKTINTLLVHRFTPNVAKFVGFWECNISKMMETMDFKQRQIFERNLSTIYKENGFTDTLDNYKYMSANMLIIEKINGTSFDSYIKSTHDEETVISLIFQVIYTLNVFNAIGIRHGDLHIGNIMVDTTPRNNEKNSNNYISYVLQPSLQKNSVYYTIPANALAKIYDWDFGGIYEPSFDFPPIDNIKAGSGFYGMCDTISSCNRNTKADLYTFLGTLWSSIKYSGKYPNILSFIERNINIDLLMFGLPGNMTPGNTFDKSGGFNFRLCKGPLVYDLERSLLLYTNNRCSGDWEPPEELIKSPYNILKDPIFDQWKHSGKIHNHNNNIYGIWDSYDILEAYYN
jgi:serine/threonine protein kinase